MYSIIPPVKPPNIKALVDAFCQNTVEPILGTSVLPPQWEAIAPFLQSFLLPASQILIAQGTLDRTVYFLEEGSLSVHVQDESGLFNLAILKAGSAVGEGAFFSNMPRTATVQSVNNCKLWKLSYNQFNQLAQKNPRAALSLSLGLGGLITKRLSDRRTRSAIT